MFEIRSMDDRLNEAFAPLKIIAAMLVFFGGLALILAALGVYGVVAFSVSQRTREIGIRAALGADRAGLLFLFLRQGLLLLSLGIIPGLLASLAATRALNSMLSEITTVATGFPVAGSVALLAVSVSVATLLPAWRAATTDPLAAIRHE
jgi:ABC-type antimicrobial peptide transport system permease subunit